MTTLPCTWRPAWSSTAGADLFDREARRDWYPDLAFCDDAGNLVCGVGGVSAARRRDSVELGGDDGDALVRDAEFPCGVCWPDD